MTKYVPYTLLSLLSLSCLAQTERPVQTYYRESTVGFSIGPAVPVGEFGSSNINSNYAGFAKPGLNIQLTYAHEIKPPNWGYLLRIIFTDNQFNTNSIKDYYTLSNSQVRLDIKSTPWITINFMGGLYYLHEINSMYLEPRLLAGFASTVSPSIKLTAPNQAYIKQNSASAMSLSLLAGTALKKRLNKSTIGVEVDYYYTRAYFPTITTTSNFGFYNQDVAITQPIHQLLITATIEWLLK